MGNHWFKRTLRESLLREQGGNCAYCKSPLHKNRATIDHRWPRSKRGSLSRRNAAACCRPCNIAKGNLSDVDLYRLIDRGAPPKNTSPEILMIWASRRIWKRTHSAVARIERFAGVAA